MGETGIRVTDAEGHLIALTKCPALDFWVNGEIGVDVLVDVDFNDEAQENLRKLLSRALFVFITTNLQTIRRSIERRCF